MTSDSWNGSTTHVPRETIACVVDALDDTTPDSRYVTTREVARHTDEYGTAAVSEALAVLADHPSDRFDVAEHTGANCADEVWHVRRLAGTPAAPTALTRKDLAQEIGDALEFEIRLFDRTDHDSTQFQEFTEAQWRQIYACVRPEDADTEEYPPADRLGRAACCRYCDRLLDADVSDDGQPSRDVLRELHARIVGDGGESE